MTVFPKLLFLTGFLFASMSCYSLQSQYPGFMPVRDTETFAKKFKEASLKVQTITSDFKQEKNLAAITEKITSNGKFWFKRNNKVRLDYTSPFLYKLIINEDRIYIQDDQGENRINVKSNRLFQQINRIIVDCIQGSILESRDFETHVFESDKQYLLEMKPVSKQLSELFSSIVLIVNRNDYSVEILKLNEAMGDNTVMFFTNKNINAAVSDNVFAF
ncbi:MAG TPA: outer membrane lipoprotein carrier protein LolA [Ohtaekwangia sp.]|nr:outer membrane lipoprotein carrier protein LolA [Ohtaekwangia sp.]